MADVDEVAVQEGECLTYSWSQHCTVFAEVFVRDIFSVYFFFFFSYFWLKEQILLAYINHVRIQVT